MPRVLKRRPKNSPDAAVNGGPKRKVVPVETTVTEEGGAVTVEFEVEVPQQETNEAL